MVSSEEFGRKKDEKWEKSHLSRPENENKNWND